MRNNRLVLFLVLTKTCGVYQAVSTPIVSEKVIAGLRMALCRDRQYPI